MRGTGTEEQNAYRTTGASTFLGRKKGEAETGKFPSILFIFSFSTSLLNDQRWIPIENWMVFLHVRHGGAREGTRELAPSLYPLRT